MASSLQDQLRRSGLIDEKKLKQAKLERRRARKSGHVDSEVTDAARAAARRQAAEKAERDRELNGARLEAEAARATAAQVRQLVERHRVPRDAGDLVFNFVDGRAVKRLHLSAGLHARVVAGELTVVRHEQGYELVPAEVAAKIAERDAACVIAPDSSGGAQGADGYEGYEVPDDLIW